LRLVERADVVAENFRPGVMEKLGLGYDALKRRNPSLIYASATGYGPDGPYAKRPGQDLLAQALFGMMAITGQAASGPRPVGVSAIDHHGAALFALGILAALVRRARTREGRRGRGQPDAGRARSAGGIFGRLAQRGREAAGQRAAPRRWLVLRGALWRVSDRRRAPRALALAAREGGGGDRRAAPCRLLR